MVWMIGTTGRTTMPRGRLDLGYKPNYNIDYKEKTVNNFGSSYGGYGMPFMPMAPGMQYGGYGYGGTVNGMDKALGIMATLTALTKGVTDIVHIVRQSTAGNEELTADATENTPTDGTKIDAAKAFDAKFNAMNKTIETLSAKQKQLIAENKSLKEASELHQAGITQNSENSYTLKYKNQSGQEVTFNTNTVEEAKQLKADLDNLMAAKGNITPDKQWQITTKDADGKEVTLTADNYQELSKKMAELQA